MADVTFPCDQEGVKKLLPHRDPFLWVTRILECDPGKSICAELDVDPNLPLFQGHFPDYKVFPGVLIMEALAQAACCCIFAENTDEVRVGFLAGIDKARFREQVKPGDTIRLRAEIVKNNGKFCKAEVRSCKMDPESGEMIRVAEAEQRYVLSKE